MAAGGDSLHQRAAALVQDAFEDYNARFSDLTRRARRRFLHRDWRGAQGDAVARLELFDSFLPEALGRLEALLGERVRSRAAWAATRDAYAARIAALPDRAFYETFFNSLSRGFFRTEGVAPAIEFHDYGDDPTGDPACPGELFRHPLADDAAALWRALLADRAFGASHANADGCARAIADAIAMRLAGRDEAARAVCLLRTTFFRERRAYLVGRIDGARAAWPLVVALVHDGDGIRADAVLTDADQVSILFGHARSPFHADLGNVGDAVAFLRTLLPGKPVDELYSMFGRGKQGKTERYRQVFRHLRAHPDERLVRADGIRGMVMAVFTPRALPVVFKVIRDRFAEPKDSVRADIEGKYRLVARRDRVGRLVDAQEFRRLRFPRAVFEASMLEELLGECAETVSLDGDQVLVRHCYVERRLRPLDLYAREATGDDALQAVLDYGLAIEDMARSGIFPGDLLLKNFGVSRHRRALFYDFDELCLIEDCRFRDLPEAREEDETRPLEDWLYARRDDVFPELFPRFLGLPPTLRDALRDAHGGIFDPAWWRDVQARLRAGEHLDVAPYPDSARLPRLNGTATATPSTGW